MGPAAVRRGEGDGGWVELVEMLQMMEQWAHQAQPRVHNRFSAQLLKEV